MAQDSFRVAVVGLGNIGAIACDLLGRLPEVSELTLIDKDTYDVSNLTGQCISRADVGVAKAEAQRRRLHLLRPDLKVTAHVARHQDLPLGVLDCDLVCGCLDSRKARVDLSRACWRLGVPFLDGGVNAAEGLVRVDGFLPGEANHCMECAFTAAHYDADVVYPCQREADPPSTNAAAYQGALVAALLVAEAHRVLTTSSRESAPRRKDVQVLYNLESREILLSENKRCGSCRFDHTIYAPEWSGSRTLDALIAAGDLPFGRVSLLAPGKRFVIGGGCSSCGRSGRGIRCVPLAEAAYHKCRCGHVTPLHPALLLDRLWFDDLPKRMHGRTPACLGLRVGDLFTICDSGGDRHYLLGTRA